jgi:hypothetical protein
MTTPVETPKKVSKLNTKLLPVAAVLLLVLALLFVATPLLRGSTTGFAGGANRQYNGTFVPRTGSGGTSGGQNFVATPGTGTQGGGITGQSFPGQGNSTTGRTFTRPTGTTSSLLRLSLLSGITGTIVYALLLLVALAAALGLFLAKRWGQILGIVMAVVYLILGLFSFLPMFLLGFARGLNGLSLGLGIVHVILAIAVIIFAVIPARKVLTPAVPSTPPTPPVAST